MHYDSGRDIILEQKRYRLMLQIIFGKTNVVDILQNTTSMAQAILWILVFSLSKVSLPSFLRRFLLLVHILIVFILEFWMDLLMMLFVLLMMLLAEQEVTHIAAVCLLFIVDELVAFQVVAGGKGPFTAVAGIRPSSCMNALVLRVMRRWLQGSQGHGRSQSWNCMCLFSRANEKVLLLQTLQVYSPWPWSSFETQFGLSSVSLCILSTVSKINLGTSGSSEWLAFVWRKTTTLCI